MDYCNIQNPKPLLVFALMVFLFLNLTFAVSSQIMISSAYATSNNYGSEESNPVKTTSDIEVPSQDEQQQESESDDINNDNDDSNNQSSSPTSGQENQCSSDTVQEPRYIDEKGCSVPCPGIDGQIENMPEGCFQEQSVPQNPVNLADSSQGLQQQDIRLLTKEASIQNLSDKGMVTVN
jgi:hypothetical protein